ncbi:MAG: hypothetical protein ACMXYB_03910 [Candidatus Woesearchaeota archaeon]
MGGHLHIHFPKKKPSIQVQLNEFLQLEEKNSDEIIKVLQLLKSYLSYFFESFASIFSDTISAIKNRNLSKSITLLEHCLEEITFHHISLNEVYESKFIEYFDATKCLPLSELTIQEIISYFLASYYVQQLE